MTHAGFDATVLTLYPDLFPGPLGIALSGKALETGLWTLKVVDIRDHAHDKHRSVDDTPTGGGAGMVMRPDVLASAIDAHHVAGRPLIYFSPRGRRMDQALVGELKAGGGATLICGRFEGVDERVLEARPVMEVSLGDFVLSGGEFAAFALLDAVVRLLPGVVGNADTLAEESFTDGLLEYPQYTRPREWEGKTPPDVLLSGDHARIRNWRKAEAERITRERRPDLWRRYKKEEGQTNESD
ncbi:tRNA (guanosine(37)-N1)-methyltransferase TrmD [Minwuia sp.]|uniref:tRNA (guanosine(37)-N1)-methyltransferase TrmD n=1 Tax=Minwuia sp. TaxID=2493630 RepID=UPI003A940F1A